MKCPSFTYCRICFASHLDLSWVLRILLVNLILNTPMVIVITLSQHRNGCPLHLATKFSLTRH